MIIMEVINYFVLIISLLGILNCYKIIIERININNSLTLTNSIINRHGRGEASTARQRLVLASLW